MADGVSGYNVLEKVGDGARSQVYRVVEPSSGQTYALKRVHRASHEDTRFLEQAMTEYQVAVQFRQSNLRRCFDMRRIRRMLRLIEVQVVMEYVEGLSLDRRPATSIDETLDIFRQVADGLSALHAMGLLHTDIKPNNILITREGQVKIIDFGQCCRIGERKPRIQGTPDYIAPEQVERHHLTVQTDVFNYGATLYWALTNRPYPTLITKRGGAQDAARQLAKPVVPPVELNPAVPPSVSRLVMDACQYDRTRRPRDMREILSRLDMTLGVPRAAANGTSQTNAPANPAPRGIAVRAGDRADGRSGGEDALESPRRAPANRSAGKRTARPEEPEAT